MNVSAELRKRYAVAMEKYLETLNFEEFKKGPFGGYYPELADKGIVITKNYAEKAIRRGLDEFIEFMEKYAYLPSEKLYADMKPMKSRDRNDIMRADAKGKLKNGGYAQLLTYKNIQLNANIRPSGLVAPLEAFAAIDRDYRWALNFPGYGEEFLILSDMIRLIPREEMKDRLKQFETAALSEKG